MTQDALYNVDVEKYQHLLKSGFGVQMRFALLDTQGRYLESAHALSASEQFSIANVVRRNHLLASEKTLQYIPDDRSLLLVRSVDVGESTVVLTMLNRFESPSKLNYCSVTTNAVEIAFESILDSVLLNYELNDMADDLSARYEELNLFYGLDDIVESQEASRGRFALKKLADNCSKYLNTDVVSITVKNADMDVDSRALCSRDFLAQWEDASAALIEKLSGGLTAHSRPMVFNNVNDIMRISDGRIKAKIAVTPIHSANGVVLGILSMARMVDGKDFSNSDRRLLRVVAEQASTIVSSSYDVMTGLLNRNGLLSSLNKTLRMTTEQQYPYALLVIDLNQFSVINDSCGRAAGDELIRLIAGQLRNMNRGKHQIARLEADKFAILIKEVNAGDAWNFAGEVLRNISETGFRWDKRNFDISAGIGIVNLDDSISDADEAIAHAILSCGVAKHRGRGEIFLYNAESAAIESARGGIDWIPHIRTALEKNTFELFGQQIVPLQSDPTDTVHYEILLRLRAEDGSVGSPFQMIQAAEEYKMISRIDEWVISHTLKAIKKCQRLYPDITVNFSVNMSGQSVNDEFFQWLRARLLEDPTLIPCINLEITETNVVSNLTSAIRLIESLRSLGVRFSLDDFGSGMSSFGYLRDLPVDYLKIDGAFVKHIVEDPISHAMVESIHRVGQLMGLQTVAEFVENDLITGKLKKLGINYGQGYGLNKPAPLFEQLEQFAQERLAGLEQAKSANQGG